MFISVIKKSVEAVADALYRIWPFRAVIFTFLFMAIAVFYKHLYSRGGNKMPLRFVVVDFTGGDIVDYSFAVRSADKDFPIYSNDCILPLADSLDPCERKMYNIATQFIWGRLTKSTRIVIPVSVSSSKGAVVGYEDVYVDGSSLCSIVESNHFGYRLSSRLERKSWCQLLKQSITLVTR